MRISSARRPASWKGRPGLSAAGFYVKGQQLVAQEDPPGDPMAIPTGGFGAAKLAGPAPGEVNTVPASALLGTELRAKYSRLRFQEAIPIYQSLIEAEPTNEAALFDLAQSQSAINRTQCAIDAYEQLLDVNPCHLDAATALFCESARTMSESDNGLRLSRSAWPARVGKHHLGELHDRRAPTAGRRK